MNTIQDLFTSFIEQNAVFFHTWGIPLILLGFLLLLILIYILNKAIQSFRIRLIITVFLIFPMIFLTLLTFLLTSPLNSFISTLANVKNSISKPVPGFEFLNLYDNTIHNINEFHGKVVILNYWSTECSECEKEFPKLKAFEGPGTDQVVVISISYDPVDSVRNYIQNHPSPSLTGVSPGTHWIEPGIHLPFNIIIDKSGIVRGYFYGKEDFQQLKEACKKYLKENQH